MSLIFVPISIALSSVKKLFLVLLLALPLLLAICCHRIKAAVISTVRVIKTHPRATKPPCLAGLAGPGRVPCLAKLLATPVPHRDLWC